LRSRLAELPAEPMLRRPTPLDELPRLSLLLGGPRIFMKREDLSGLAMGGNKTRELDYFIGAAKTAGADVFIAGGGVAQSNHAVQCAAAARRAGLLPVLVLHGYRSEQLQGNHLLARLLGADIRFVETADVDSAINQRVRLLGVMEEAAREYAARGHRPWILKSSFHPLGAAGFVDCAAELAEQVLDATLDVDHVYLTSAGATQVGLVLGNKILGAPYRVTGISYTVTVGDVVSRMVALGNQTAELLGLPERLEEADIVNQEAYAGEGYGIPSPEGLEAIRLLAETEGIFLDPVYTSKGMAGLIDHIRGGRLQAGETVVFIHTGGTSALFAYAEELLAARPRPRAEHVRET
jgi:1-aminocyclopropane-1-carboxylate deaminase/D-cysteine desulfhydrase-like pyridoxal-dependent ACC family enzyme